MRKNKLITLLIMTLLTTCITACGGSDSSSTTNDVSDEYLGEIIEEEVTLDEIEILSLDISKHVTLGDYKTIISTIQSATVTDAQIKEKVNEYIKQYGTEYEQIIDRTIIEGDLVNLQYSTLIDGETIEKVDDMFLKVGSNYMIPEFEKALIGKNVNEAIRLNVVVDESNEKYAGKDATYTITINYICGNEIKNEYNDEYVKKITNEKYPTVAEFEKSIRDSLEKAADVDVKSLAWKEIVDDSSVKDIDKYIDEELKVLIKEYRQNTPNPKMSDETLAVYAGFKTYEEFEADMRLKAEQIMKEEFVTYAIAQKENLLLSADEYKIEAEKLANEYNYDNIFSLEEVIPRNELYYTILYRNVIENITK